MREMEASVGRMEASMGRMEERLGVTTNDANLLIPASATHAVRLGRVPGLVASDAASIPAGTRRAAKAMGVKRVCVPNGRARIPNASRGATARNVAPDAKDVSAWSTPTRVQSLSAQERGQHATLGRAWRDLR
jgi:hypothetical protein